jgi:hypothetical protein
LNGNSNKLFATRNTEEFVMPSNFQFFSNRIQNPLQNFENDFVENLQEGVQWLKARPDFVAISVVLALCSCLLFFLKLHQHCRQSQPTGNEPDPESGPENNRQRASPQPQTTSRQRQRSAFQVALDNYYDADESYREELKLISEAMHAHTERARELTREVLSHLRKHHGYRESGAPLGSSEMLSGGQLRISDDTHITLDGGVHLKANEVPSNPEEREDTYDAIALKETRQNLLAQYGNIPLLHLTHPRPTRRQERAAIEEISSANTALEEHRELTMQLFKLYSKHDDAVLARAAKQLGLANNNNASYTEPTAEHHITIVGGP